jgi:hypothetical protein
MVIAPENGVNAPGIWFTNYVMFDAPGVLNLHKFAYTAPGNGGVRACNLTIAPENGDCAWEWREPGNGGPIAPDNGDCAWEWRVPGNGVAPANGGLRLEMTFQTPKLHKCRHFVSGVAY